MAPPAASDSPVRQGSYRPAVPVSAEISKHCHIYLDEGIYISALHLLTDLVVPGASHPNRLTIPCFAPIPLHIETISNLLIHPKHTSQATETKDVQLGSKSLYFLRSVLANLGPINANLSEAFSLTPPIPKAGRRSRYGGGEGSDDSEDDEMDHINGNIANKGRLRRCAKDFWHIVGWAFNCSVVHQNRWKYWKVWLDFMLDVLDADYREREAQDKEIHQNKLKEDPTAQLDRINGRECLTVKYLANVKGKSTALRRVVGAIFTDGGADDLRSYPEVFENETQELRSEADRKRKRADTLNDEFDEFDDDAQDDQSLSSSQLGDATPPPSSQATDNGDVAPDPYMGGPEAIILRLRVMSLLSRIATYLPQCFARLTELYELYVTSLKQVPVPAFSLLISTSPSSPFPMEGFVSLTELLLLRMLPNSAPLPQTVPGRPNDELSQPILEQCFLPFAASTSSPSDNAKVSIVVENMLRLFIRTANCYHTPTLDAAIEQGIAAREAKSKGDKRRRNKGALTKEEESDRVWLTASSRRLRTLLAWVEHQNSN